MRAKIETKLKNGTELVNLEIGQGANPWIKFAGMFKDDPLIKEWKKSMAEYRRKVDQDADRP